jgi:SAM-dependent methyltransferase
MDKITVPTKPEVEKYIFTAGIDYFTAGKDSIWGQGDKETLKILRKTEIKGDWLNLASGDGRYNKVLLEKADSVLASDIDKSALSKLWHTTPEKYLAKLKIKKFDISKKFPVENESFDGIFCTGVLHLFPKEVLQNIVSEMDRVLKPKGKLIIDFSADISRTSQNGKAVTFGRGLLYNLEEARGMLKALFRNYKVRMQDSKVVEDFEGANPPYTLTCNFVILVAYKN